MLESFKTQAARSAHTAAQRRFEPMNRRTFVKTTAAAGFAASASLPAIASAAKLTVPDNGIVPVAVVISKYATVIDFCGPWEAFQDAQSPGTTGFQLYTVSHTTEPVEATAGLKIVPNYTFENAPAPKVIVIPAQGGANEATYKWLQKTSPGTDVTMSVCTGAFVLGRAGLLAGKEATTHHDFFDKFEKAFPDVKLRRGVRFVENDKISTAGGLTSGIDMALRVIERYFGRDVAQKTADYMEYQSKGWIV
jgi:transcriptional regulator GlxA family with amidase domain